MNATTFPTLLTKSLDRKTTLSSSRKTALAAGVLYLLTFVSIPTLGLYLGVHKPGYVMESGADNAVIVGGLLEIIVALAGIGTALVLYPVLKVRFQTMSLALVASRVLEAGTMFTGVAFLLTVVGLRQTHAGAQALPVSHALVALYDHIFLLGQGFVPAINDLLLGIMLYRSRLVPRLLSLTGIVGAFPLFAGYLAILFGVIGQHSILAGLAALLVAVFEFSLGIYLVVKGFKAPVSAAVK